MRVTLAVRCHRMLPTEALCVAYRAADDGDGDACEQWNVLPMNPCSAAVQQMSDDRAEWWVTLALPRSSLPLTYKFGIVARDDTSAKRHQPRTEARPRTLPSPEPLASKPVVALLSHCGYLRHPDGPWRGAGVAVPVFSLRSATSLGCGDFGDLAQLVRLAATTGLRCVQILPVNDTRCDGTWRDSYPYSCASTAALHPLYLQCHTMCLPATAPPPPHITAMIQDARARLDGLHAVDYEATLDAKLRIARAWFDHHTAHPGGALAPGGGHTGEFASWVDENAHWLRPYAVFCFLKDIFGTAEHWTWGAMARADATSIERLASPDAPHGAHNHMAFTAYVQWHLHRQLSDAAAEAASRRVLLKGDLPIGVDKRSCDTWLHPSLFRMTASAGAPPDAFDANGQNWGFPTYVWPAMAADRHYAWWRTRLHHMRRYFSALRVDHVLGFFRIWELPASSVSGLLGRFRPAEPLTRIELERRGLWDILRLVTPYIRRHVLVAAFGSGAVADEVAAEFMEPCAADGSSTLTVEGGACSTGPHTRWRFKSQFATESGLLAASSLHAADGSPTWLADQVNHKRKALLTLLHNVCLLRDEERPEECFHPRFDMRATSSFGELEPWQQDALNTLSDDYWHGRQDKGWRAHARATLPPLQAASGMLICGEDLGLVPPCVAPVLRDLGVLSLRIQRMPPASVGGPFDVPDAYPHSCVCSPSCHDVTTTRAWWEQDAQRRLEYAARFLPGALGGDFARAYVDARSAHAAAVAAAEAEAAAVASTKAQPAAVEEEEGCPSESTQENGNHAVESPDIVAPVVPVWSETEAVAAARQAGPPPPQVASPELMRCILAQHLASPAALAIFPMQDVCALDAHYCASVPPDTELINDPTVKRHYWRYRMRDSLEELAANTQWADTLRQLVHASGRDVSSRVM